MLLGELKTAEERLQLLKKTAEIFQERAREHDENGTFPYENMNDLKKIGYPALAVPKNYGGLGITLGELLKMQEVIAQYDGSTALAIGWHMGITKHTGETEEWRGNQYAQFAKDVLTNMALINNAATEPATGSPTRGGKPETFVKKTSVGWVLNGRKTFTTLSPVLDYVVVSASIDGTDDVARFLVRRHLKGVSIDETWNSIAMKATGSHDLVLEDVELNEEDLIAYEAGQKGAQGWLLHIPACYLGIAKAAQGYATKFAASYSPNSIKGTIADIPSVQQKIGQMALHIFEATTMLYAIAQKWDQADAAERKVLGTYIGATKVAVVDRALTVVDIAMRIVGARSLSADNPLQRYYRDVRAGLHNPPMDDMIIQQLAKLEIEKI